VIVINNHFRIQLPPKILKASLAAWLLFFSVLAGGCQEMGREKGTVQPGPPPKPPTVVVANVFEKSVPIYGEYAASFDPSTGAEIADVRARVDALLLEQHFREGEPVTKGQLLFSLDPSTYKATLDGYYADLAKGQAELEQATNTVSVLKAKADVEAAKAQLYLAEVTEKRLKPLAEKKAVPQQDYDNAYANLKVAKANLDVAQANLKNTILNQKVNIEQAKAAIELANANIAKAKINLSYCTITAPITGVAGKRLVSPGNLVGHGEATLLTQVTNLTTVRINFDISETDYIRIMKRFNPTGHSRERSSPPLQLILADGSTYRFKGKIDFSQPSLNPKTGTLNVVGIFDNPDRLLRPGMFGRIRVPIDFRNNAVLLPQESIVMIQSAKMVYTVDDKNKVGIRNVSVGDLVGNNLIVLSGVKAGDRVITQGQLKVHPDMEVTPETKSARPSTKPEASHGESRGTEKGEK
jgi:RND family efflux transporter MFP subunit